MRSLTVVCAASFVVCGSVALAGPLNPPAGAIVSSGKTLVDVEPRTAITPANTPGDADSTFKITQPVSYYLTGNVTGANNKHGIEVAADHVTIDLNGFSLLGVAGARDAVRSDGGPLALGFVVKNGTINGWTNGSGVYAGGVTQCRVEDVTITSVNFEGVWTGPRSVIARCHTKTTRSGLRTGNNSVVKDCTVETATERGIQVDNDSRVSGCVVRATTQTAISTQYRCGVEDCRVFNAGSGGVSGVDDCVFRNIDVQAAAGPGVIGGARCTFSHCTIGGTGDSGIIGQQDCRVDRCSVFDASAHGYNLGATSVITDSEARSCSLNGINTQSNCTVKSCTAGFNHGNGVLVDQLSVVSGNNCVRNGLGTGAGIRVTGGGCRIEDNHCTGADFGVQVASANNWIVRNTCSGNTTNWSIAANNVFGPIIDRTATGSAAVNGNSAADQTGSSHPNANFTH